VQREVQELELDYAVQPLRQVMEQGREIAVDGDRFRYLQQGTVLADSGVGIGSDSLILACTAHSHLRAAWTACSWRSP
jgi:hypothetical protein